MEDDAASKNGSLLPSPTKSEEFCASGPPSKRYFVIPSIHVTLLIKIRTDQRSSRKESKLEYLEDNVAPLFSMIPLRIIRYSFPNKSSWQIKNTELDSTSFAERRVSVFALVSVLENRDPSFPLRWRGLPDFPRSSGPEQRDTRVTPVSRRFVGAAAARLCCFINKIHRDPRTGWATTPRGPVWQPERKRKRELAKKRVMRGWREG